MKYFIASLFFLVVVSSYSQVKKKTIYLNENYVEITKKEHKKKLNSEIYHSLTYDLDSLLYKKIRLSYFFGKLDLSKKQQLFKLLHVRNGIDTTKTLIFHYIDTLKVEKQFPKNDTVIRFKDGGHRNELSYKSFLKHHKDCSKKYEGFVNVNVLHYYYINNGHETVLGELVWCKDPSGIISRLFSDTHESFKYFILKPKGDFYVQSVGETKIDIFNEVLKEKWSEHEAKFYKEYNKLNKKL
jgi:Fe-S cluster biosynthesis and repair protein YggX